MAESVLKQLTKKKLDLDFSVIDFEAIDPETTAASRVH